MPKKMLIDASHPEETRVVVLSGNRLEEFDFETAAKKQLKGNIYLARVTRVEPSLQAAFVEYGGNRHGFLAFSEIHPDYYRIPVADREALIEEERRAAAKADREEHEEAEEASAPDDASDEKPAKGRRRRSRRKTAKREDVETVSEAVPADGEPPAAEEASAETHPVGADVAADEDEERAGQREAGEDGAQPVRVEVIGGDDMAEHSERRRTPNYRNYKIQEVIKRRQIMLVQVTKEERGNKGAALTTYLSLAGRYCVLMPNTPRGGGISRKIANPKDRKKMKAIMDDLEVPEGMAVILRTAGLERTRQEIKRDLDYLLRLWDSIRETTLQSTAPCAIHEEANLIKRAIRDLYSRDIDEIEVQGDEGYRVAKDFMRMLMPSHAKKVQLYKDDVTPLFHRYQVETQIDAMHSPVVQLKSGGYIVINPTEALVSIDVNSGRATRERNIEETAYRTNLEAADEVARQLRLRDLAGLIVVDFIDMEDDRHNAAVERRLKEAMRQDRARIQIGRISPFGLLELSRQRLRPSLLETHFETCPHCAGTGHVRSIGSAALSVLRAIEEEGIKGRASEIRVLVATRLALVILNQKRDSLQSIEQRYGLRVYIEADDTLVPPAHRIDKLRDKRDERATLSAPVDAGRLLADTAREYEEEEAEEDEAEELSEGEEEVSAPSRAEAASRPQPRRDEARPDETGERGGRRRRRRRRRRGQGPGGLEIAPASGEAGPQEFGHDPRDAEAAGEAETAREESEAEIEVEVMELGAQPVQGDGRRRRRGRRGGRRRGGAEGGRGEPVVGEDGEFEVAAEFVEIDTTPREPESRAVEAPAEEPAVAPEPSLGPVEDAVAEAESAGQPKRKASRRKPKPKIEPEATVPAAEPAPEPVAEEASPRPKRRPSRAKKVEPATDSAPQPDGETGLESAEVEAEAPVPEPEPVPVPPPLAAVTVVGADAEVPEKPKRGWWNRIVKG